MIDRPISPAHVKAETGVKPLWFHIGSEGDLAHQWADGAHTYGIGPDGKGGQDWHEMVDPRENALLRLHRHMSGVGSDLWRVYANLDYAKTPNEITLTMVIEFIIDERERLALEALVQSLHRNGVEVNVMHEAHDAPGKDQVEVVFNILGMSYAEVCALQLRLLNEPLVQALPMMSVL